MGGGGTVAILIHVTVLCRSSVRQNHHDWVKNVAFALSHPIFLTYTHTTVIKGGVLTNKRTLGEMSLMGDAERRGWSGLRSGPPPCSPRGHTHTRTFTCEGTRTRTSTYIPGDKLTQGQVQISREWFLTLGYFFHCCVWFPK